MKRIMVMFMALLIFFLVACTEQNTNTAPADLVGLTFQPMQCQQTLWEKWYADGNIQYVKAPTDEELVKSYYSQVYGIDIAKLEKVQSDKIVCQACDICPKSYYFQAQVPKKDVAEMLELGWKQS